MVNQKFTTIKNLLNFLNNKFENYHIVFRPHPKINYTHPNHISFLNEEKDISVDKNDTRSIGNLLKGSSLVVTDYGSSVLDAIYLKKKVLNVTWPNDKIMIKNLQRRDCNDYFAKKFLVKIYFKKNFIPSISKRKIKYLNSKEYTKKINNLKTKLFGQKKKNLKNLIFFKKNINNNTKTEF